jgi:hypothetical protein
VRFVYPFLPEGRRRVLDQGDVIAELHASASGGLDAGVRFEPDEDDPLDPPLCELSVGEAALSPMLEHDDV